MHRFSSKIANFTGKHVYTSLLWLSCRHQISNFIKKRLQHRLFPVKFAKFLRAPCFTEHLQWLLLKVSGFQPATLLRKRLRKKCFAVNFAKFFEHLFFWQNTSRWLLLVLISEFWDVFQNTSFKEHLGETATSCASCRISATRYSKKLLHRCFSSILYQIEK